MRACACVCAFVHLRERVCMRACAYACGVKEETVATIQYLFIAK